MGEIGTGSFLENSESAVENEDESDQAKASSPPSIYPEVLLNLLL